MPITISPNDLVICGRGAANLKADFTVPSGIDLYSLQTPDSGMTHAAVSALVGRRSIDRLVSLGSDGAITDLADTGIAQPIRNPASVPNVRLSALGELRFLVEPLIATDLENVILIDQDTDLQSLLSRPEVKAMAHDRVGEGTALRVFWIGCDFDEADSSVPHVYHNAQAVALAGNVYAQRTGKSARRASADAFNHARLNPDDTSGAMMAAAVTDPATATQVKPLPDVAPFELALPTGNEEMDALDHDGTPDESHGPHDIRMDLGERGIVESPTDIATGPAVGALQTA